MVLHAEISDGIYTLTNGNGDIVAVVAVGRVAQAGYPTRNFEVWDLVNANGAPAAGYAAFPDLSGGGVLGTATTLTWTYKGAFTASWHQSYPSFPPAHGVNPGATKFTRWIVHSYVGQVQV